MNQLFLGLTKQIAPTRGLFLHDTVSDIPRARVFDPALHSFNPLKGMDYRKAVDLVAILMTIFPGGETTLTKEGAQHFLLEALLAKPKTLEGLVAPSKDPSQEKARRMVERLLLSPVLKNVLCKPSNFSFNPNSQILAKLDRAELGEFDALVLGLFLIGQFKGQITVVDGGFYLRDSHRPLLREERLIVGVNHMGELQKQELLRDDLWLVSDKQISGVIYDDATELAKYARITPNTVEWHDYIAKVMI